MDKQVISFNVNEQQLTRIGGECHYSSNKVSYIEAHFELGANWDGFDSVRAVWFTDFVKGISTVLDADGICIVPTEVLRYKGKASVNLVGSVSVADVLTDRLTSYPITALIVDANARVESTETAEVTPSQFDQFVAIVRDEVEEVTGMTAEAETLPAGSEATASYSGGVLTFGIPRGAKGQAGQDGQDGADGADGFSPIVTVTEITGGHEVSIEDSTQTQTFDVMDGTTPVIPWDSILPVDSASGAIASFPDGTDLVPCKSLQVALEPIQEGSGTPSPDNVRPISGRTEVDTIVSPTTEAEDGETYTTDLGRTVYGGTLDVVSGELVVDRAYIDLDGTNHYFTAKGNYWHIAPYDYDAIALVVGSTAPQWVLSSFTEGISKWGTAQNGTQLFTRGTSSWGGIFDTLEEINTFITNDPQTIVYPLATPQTYQLDAQTIDLLLGQNNVWSDGDVVVTYNADIQRYIEKKLS